MPSLHFVFFFFKAIDNAVASEGLARVATLKSSMRYTIFQWVARGIFEKHKLLYVKRTGRMRSFSVVLSGCLLLLEFRVFGLACSSEKLCRAESLLTPMVYLLRLPPPTLLPVHVSGTLRSSRSA